MLWSHIDAEGMCSMLHKLQQVATSSTPYFKNRVAAMFAKFGHLIKATDRSSSAPPLPETAECCSNVQWQALGQSIALRLTL